jgi:WD40 repeat protein
LHDDPSLSVVLAYQAGMTKLTPEAVSALRQSLGESRERAVLGHQMNVFFASYSRDGTLALTATRGGEVLIWEMPTGGLEATMKVGRKPNTVNFSPDGKHVVTGEEDGTVRVWDSHTGASVASTNLGSTVFHAEFSPGEGKQVVATGKNCAVKLWEWEGEPNKVTSLNGCGQNGVVDNDTGPGEALASKCRRGSWTAAEDVFTATFSANGGLVAAGSGDCMVRVWDVATRQLKVLPGHIAEVNQVVFSPDGDSLVSASGLPGGGWDSASLLWTMANWKSKELPGGKGPRSVQDVRAGPVAFSVDSKYVATTGVHQNVLVWDAKTGAPWTELRGHTHWIASIEFSPKDSSLLVTAGDHTARVWNIGSTEDTGQEVFTLRGHHGDVVDAAFNSQGDEIITASFDGARLWTLSWGELSGRGQPRCCRESTVISPNKKLTLTLPDQAIRDHDVLRHDNFENRDLPPLQGHEQRVESAAFSPDGTLIVTAGGADNTARVWDSKTGKTLKIFGGHEGPVWPAEFDKTGTLVVTASGDGTARVWDTASGESVAIFGRGGKPLSRAWFTSDNTSVITMEFSSGALRSYHCNSCQLPEQLLPLAQEKSRERPLSPDEKRTFLHDETGGI